MNHTTHEQRREVRGWKELTDDGWDRLAIRNNLEEPMQTQVLVCNSSPWEATVGSRGRLRVLRGSVSRWKTEIERKTRGGANQKETRPEEGSGGLGQLCNAELGPVPATQSSLLSCWLVGIASLTMQGKFCVELAHFRQAQNSRFVFCLYLLLWEPKFSFQDLQVLEDYTYYYKDVRGKKN